MRADLLKLAADLAARHEAFVFAVVTRREPASSAQPGNMAVITGGGQFHGWLGGSCIRPTVVREAAAAIEAGAPRLISLSPDPDAERRDGVTTFPMTCHSGGTVEIYLEPVIPAPRLLVFGLTPIAAALVRLGDAMGYRVDVVDPDADASSCPGADRVGAVIDAALLGPRPAWMRDRVFAVVATQGERDEDAAQEAIAADPAYLAVVASRQRFAQIREALAADGVPAETIERIRNPAGLDINAKAPEEVALSIVAEIVQQRRSVGPGSSRLAQQDARDPVCGMTVQVAGARHTAEHGGRTYYFCCGGCRQRFLASPEAYVVAVPSR